MVWGGVYEGLYVWPRGVGVCRGGGCFVGRLLLIWLWGVDCRVVILSEEGGQRLSLGCGE